MSHRIFHKLPGLAVTGVILAFLISAYAGNSFEASQIKIVVVPGTDSGDDDTLKYPIKNTTTDPMGPDRSHSFDLKTPSVIEKKIEIDSTLSNYRLRNTISGLLIGDEKVISLNEYIRQNNLLFQQNYFRERSKAQNFLQGSGSLLPKLTIKAPKLVEDLVGGGIDIKPQGSAELIFSYDYTRVKNPNWSLRQQRTPQFKFDQKIKLSVRGNIGNKIGLGIGYDTESSFEFDNEIKLRFEGEEDDIVKLLEAGNVTLPVQGTLISGSQSLFGVKSKLQFGKLTVTSVFSQQKSEKKEITLENGAQKSTFRISALEYDANRHFFLNQYFRNQVFEQALAKLPIIQSPIQITRTEVWVINRTGSTTDVRNIVAFMDLGEPDPWNADPNNPNKGDGSFVAPFGQFPDNEANTLYKNLKADPGFRSNATVSQKLTEKNASPTNFYNGVDYVKIDNARRLTQSEYTVNQQLGFISLNQRLDPGYALAVAYEYTYNGVRYQVGEFAQDVPPDPTNQNVLFLKLIKSTANRTDIPMWDLMMKNIYSLGTSQVQQNEFKLDIIYEDDKTGANLNYIPEVAEPKLSGKFLIQVLGLDRLNSKQEEMVDGVFDFLDGRTIFPATGRIMFPTLEPFGRTLRKYFVDPKTANKYAFDAIYDSTQVQAEQLKQFDKFYIKGQYLGAAGSEISLNAINVPEGSVKVTAGGAPLRENVDYTVDYTMGRVKIINQSILNSGLPIKITAESQTLFSILQKTLIGSRFDYKFTEDFNLGGTVLYLKEKPITRKVNIGEEPINNVILGMDGSFRADSRLITKLIDRIPLIETKEKSEILITGEFATLIPGHPQIIGNTGTSYIDDFEGSEVPYDLRTGNYWVLASTPQGQPNIFTYGNVTNDISYNFRRAKLAWYTIDEAFYSGSSITPPNITPEMLSKHRMRQVQETEVFPYKQMQSGFPTNLRTFDLAYFPSIRGSYNFDAASLGTDGLLKNPEQNWAGIMRRIETNDFEAANIEYLEFWLMDPYADSADYMPDNGRLYIHLGDVSEDILRDGIKTFENGFPRDGDTSKMIKTIWGYVPSTSPINYAFDNETLARQYQDIGLDGLSDAQERWFYDSIFIKKLPSGMDAQALAAILADPSADNYHFFRGEDLDKVNADIIERYKHYKNTEGNSPISKPGEPYSTSGSLSPDVEDINNDFTLNEVESYFQYVIELHPNMQVGENYIVDKQLAHVPLKQGGYGDVYWYQFKIPVRAYEKRVGQIRDFKSIRFIRLALTDFSEPIVCRFGRLQLVRGDWRRYLNNLNSPGEVQIGDPDDNSTFDISTVNYEANGKRTPIPYVLPPGIERETDYTTTELIERNEQSLLFTACIEDGDAKAAYKNTYFDIRNYKRLKMYVHAEAFQDENSLEPGDLTLFIRLGTDFSGNYYEYELPLYPTRYGTNDPEEIWKKINEVDLSLDEFYRVKQERDIIAGTSMNIKYSRPDTSGKGIVSVLGNPDLSNIKIIMLGVRNPKKDSPNNPRSNDDGLSKCGIIWVNELRVTDFDERGGSAGIARLTTKLADFGKLTVTGNFKTIGFGGLEQKLQERSKEDLMGFDVQSYLELGKFFPQKAGVKIPMYYNYAQTRSRPQYNPLNPDILLRTRLDLARNKQERDSILYMSETFLERTSLNFMNVQKMKSPTKKKSHVYDIENFLASYAYTNILKRDITTEYDDKETHQFILNYAYVFKEKSFAPLSKTKMAKSKYLKLITDFNIGFIPQSFTFQTQIDRRIGEILYRNTGDVLTILKPIYDKTFTMSRVYDYKHNLTKSLRLNYNATVNAYFREPYGKLTPEGRDTLMESIYHLGEIKTFNHKINLNYELPLRKIPILDWTTFRASYTGSYNWEEAPPAADSIGNLIQNANSIQLNSQLNLISLYGKIPFLRTINQDKSNLDKIRKKKLAALKDKKKTNADGTPVTLNDVSVNESFLKTVETTLRILMTLRNITINYTLNEGTTLPGFNKKPGIIGNDWKINAPGLPFLFGFQDTNFRWEAAGNGWINQNPNLNTFYYTTSVENLNIQSTLEPVKGFRINVDMERKVSNNYQDIFRVDTFGTFKSFSPVESGNFSISYWSLPTALKSKYKDKISPTFTQFENNRYVIAQRLASEKGTLIQDTLTGYFLGYGRTAQDVLVPAFLAAYANKNNSMIALGAFPKIPAPNWRVTYSGLNKLKFLEPHIRNIVLNHAYRSTYSVGNYTSNLNYDPNQTVQMGENYIPKIRIQQVTISEQLSPLLGVDVTWKKNWSTRMEYRTDRTVSFSLANFQLSEIMNRDLAIGAGYRAKEFKVPLVKWNGKQIVLKNDVNFRFDMTLRTNQSVISILDEKTEVKPIGGSKMLAISPVFDYVVDQSLTIRLFAKYNLTKTKISTSYDNSFSSVGFSVRYTLGQ